MLKLFPFVYNGPDSTLQDITQNTDNQILPCYGYQPLSLLFQLDNNKQQINFDSIFKYYTLNKIRDYKQDTEITLEQYKSEITTELNSFKDLTDEERDDYNMNTQIGSKILTLPIFSGTIIYIPYNKLSLDITPTLSNQTLNQSYPAFIHDKQLELINDLNYQKVNSSILPKNISVENLNFSVWVWCKSLPYQLTTVEQDKELTGVILNITSFVQDLQTLVTKDGGTFSFTLPALSCSYVKTGYQTRGFTDVNSGEYIPPKDKGQWVLNKIMNIQNNNIKNFSYIESINIIENEKYFFHQILQENDIVWIRFEGLELEMKTEGKQVRNRLQQMDMLEISPSDIPNNIYDMIGLIDANSISLSPSNLQIQVSGGDLMNLLKRDGCYFFANDFIPGGIFGNETDKDYQERIDGKLFFLGDRAILTIDFCLKYLINKISKIKICPDELFMFYGDKRSKYFQLTEEAKLKRKVIEEQRGNLYKQISDNIYQCRVKEGLTEAEKGDDSQYTAGLRGNLEDFLKLLNNNRYLKNDGGIIDWEIPSGKSLTFQNEQIQSHILPNYFRYSFFKPDYEVEYQDPVVKIALEQGIVDLKNKLNEINKAHNNLGDIPLGGLDADIKQIMNAIAQENAEVSAGADYTADVRRTAINDAINQTQSLQTAIATLEGQKNNLPAPKLTYLPKDVINFENFNNFGKNVLMYLYQLITTNVNDVNDYENQYMGGIWQIIKFMIDGNYSQDQINKHNSGSDIGLRRIIDNSIGNSKESLFSTITHFCQMPWVEFSGDTYGDQYYFVVKEPPFTKATILDHINNNMFTIEAEDVLQVPSFEFTTGCYYSWYRLESKMFGDELGQNVVLAYLKAIHFKEIAKYFGERPLEVTSNYLPFEPFIGKGKALKINNMLNQALLDLKFLIDTNVLLPFTRMGKVVIKGDRRIKRGTWVYFKQTNEIFYVEAVSHSAKISGGNCERSTILQLSRGMIYTHLDKYFMLVNDNINDDTLNRLNDLSYEEKIKTIYSNWQLNFDIFKFFIEKQQFNY